MLGKQGLFRATERSCTLCFKGVPIHGLILVGVVCDFVGDQLGIQQFLKRNEREQVNVAEEPAVDNCRGLTRATTVA
jgi:hypothetical protein